MAISLTVQELSDALSLYSSKGNVPMMRKLISMGANPNYNSSLPLVCAIENNQPVAVYFLISKGANPSNGLFAAAKTNNIDILNILLDKGALISDPNIIKGAILGNNPNILLFAISKGAEIPLPNDVDSSFESPYTLALQSGNDEIIKIVQDHLLFAPLVDINKIELIKTLVKLESSLDPNLYPNYYNWINSFIEKSLK